ncbi:hypothetical protein FHY52_34625, partial [Nocardia nova]
MNESDIEQTRPVRHCDEAVTAESADAMPLSGVAIEARGEGAAAEHARRLLQELGARPENDRGQRRTVLVDSRSAVRAWADSGAMALTGRAGGPPMVSPGAPA